MATRHVAWFGIAAAVALVIAACARSDTAINAEVKSKLAADETVKTAPIEVSTSDRVVTLSGTVDRQAMKNRAVMVARQADGVADVVDQIVVNEPSPTSGAWPPGPGGHHGGFEHERGFMMSDDGIEAAVRGRLTSDALVGTLDIDVDADHGVVSLSGRVGSESERTRAIELARQTRGVMRVEDDLEMRR